MNRLGLGVVAFLATACAGQRPAAPTPAAPQPTPVAGRAPSTLRYGPESARFRVEQTSHVTQEVMGQSVDVDLSSRQVLSTVGAEVAGNLSIAFTVDSIDVTGPAGADTTLASARGQTFHLVLSPSGVVVSVAAQDTTNAILRQFSSGVRDFFPPLPAAPVAAGREWTDTLETSRAGNVTVSTTALRRHRVIGWEDRDGARALHIETTSTYSVSGSGEAQGQAVELSGAGQSVRDAFVSAAGLFLGSVERDSAQINATLTALGMAVPIRQTRRSTVTRLP